MEDFQNARDRHRIAVGSKFDWDGSGARFGWRVGSVRALAKPVPVESTGFRVGPLYGYLQGFEEAGWV